MRHKSSTPTGRWTIVVAVLVSTPAMAQTRSPSRVLVPSDNFRTIQQGIDAVAAGGTVLIKPGIYPETLVVSKPIFLIGAGARGDNRTEIVGAIPKEIVPFDRATGIVTYVPGGGGEIKAMTVRGGHAAILGVETENRVPAALQMKDMILEGSGRGILGSFSDVTVKDTQISNTLWNGLSFIKGNIKIVDSHVTGAAGAGLFLWDVTGSAVVDIVDSDFVGNGGPGIAVLGAHVVSIHDCDIDANHEAGIKLFHVDGATIWNCAVSLTLPRIADGAFGDGVDVYSCGGVVIFDSNLAFNNRIGFADFGSSAFLKNNVFYANSISLDGEPFMGSNPILTDLGGNQCYEADSNGQVQLVFCQVKNLNLAPPAPLVDP